MLLTQANTYTCNKALMLSTNCKTYTELLRKMEMLFKLALLLTIEYILCLHTCTFLYMYVHNL